MAIIEPKVRTLKVRVSKPLAHDIERLAHKHDQSRSELMRRLVRDELKRDRAAAAA